METCRYCGLQLIARDGAVFVPKRPGQKWATHVRISMADMFVLDNVMSKRAWQ